MAHFLFVETRVPQLFRELEEQRRERNECIEKEAKAATMIQTIYRGKRLHSHFCLRKAMARKIQRNVRGHFARDQWNAKLRDSQNWQDRLIYDFYAEQIQKTWRGFHSRREKHDFWARRKYIETVVEKGKEMMQQLRDYHAERTATAKAEQEQKDDEKFKHLTRNLHHLLSTSNTPGVYANPYFSENRPTVKGVSVEEHLRKAVKKYLKTHKLQRKKYPKIKGSLVANSSYFGELEHKRMERKIQKLKRVSSKPFVGRSRSKLFDKDTAHLRIKPLNCGTAQMSEPYMEPGKAFVSSKALWDRTKEGRVSDAPFYYTVHSNPLFEDYEYD